MTWCLRYAPHLGYMPPDRPLFRAFAGTDRSAHVRFAASRGMAGVLFPWATDSPAEERAAVRQALDDTGLCCSCIVSAPFSCVAEPMWVSPGRATDDLVSARIRAALAVAEELGSSQLAVLLRSDGSSALPVQRRRAAERLRKTADEVGRRQIVLAIEPMVSIPDMLLRSFAEATEFVREINHPFVKLIFDTGHVSRMGDALVETYVEAYDEIALLQLADMPGRIEPGAGELDLVNVLAHALRRGYRGLVDLEHDWLRPGPETEGHGLSLLRDMETEALRRCGV